MGTIAGIQSDKVLDGKDHFPIANKSAAQSAASRILKLSESPDWFSGDVAELAAIVSKGIAAKFPNLQISMSFGFQTAFASAISKQPKQIDLAFIKANTEKLNLSLQERMKHLQALMDLLEKMKASGLTAEEFEQLSEYTKESILYEMKGCY